MKQLTFLTCMLLFPFLAFAQIQAGEIEYTETIKLKIDIPDATEEMLKMIPSERKNPKILAFNANKSLFKNGEEKTEPEEMSHSEGDMQFNIKMVQPDNRLFLDIENGKITESTEFFGRFFLIEEALPERDWKFAKDKKMILGYECYKAYLVDTARTVEVWYTPQIPVPVGPSEFNGLPGAILEVNIDNGERSYLAVAVKTGEPEAKKIEKPSKGKSVTREEFKKIRDEKMKEMGAEPGGNGSMRVIIRN
ncbi:MAG: GLPGLI family protein [Chitinophagales bacterium]|nr:GLPGLI family protein [Chitinophagales bacterium]